MKTLLPPRDLLPAAHPDHVPNAPGIFVAVAISLVFWGVIATILL